MAYIPIEVAAKLLAQGYSWESMDAWSDAQFARVIHRYGFNDYLPVPLPPPPTTDKERIRQILQDSVYEEMARSLRARTDQSIWHMDPNRLSVTTAQQAHFRTAEWRRWAHETTLTGFTEYRSDTEGTEP